MPRAILLRVKETPSYILGRLTVPARSAFLVVSTLELPWKDNERAKSAIPEGLYKLELRFSPLFRRDCIRLVDVPGRNGILIHEGNTTEDTLGCILVGLSSGDGRVNDSRSALVSVREYLDIDHALSRGDWEIKVLDKDERYDSDRPQENIRRRREAALGLIRQEKEQEEGQSQEKATIWWSSPDLKKD